MPSTQAEEVSALRPLADYQAFLDEGRFMLLRGRKSGRFVFYPRVAEPGTGALDLEWVEASGRGVIYAVTVISQKPPTPNYNVVLVDLEEGPRMMGRVDGAPSEEIRIGMPVVAKIITENETAIVVFEPAKDGGSLR